MPTKKVKQVKKLQRDANGKFAQTAKPKITMVALGCKPVDTDKPISEDVCGKLAPAGIRKPCYTFVTTGYYPNVDPALYLAQSLQKEYQGFGYSAKTITQLSRRNAQNQMEYCFDLAFEKM